MKAHIICALVIEVLATISMVLWILANPEQAKENAKRNPVGCIGFFGMCVCGIAMCLYFLFAPI